jgi:hypothetical protein
VRNFRSLLIGYAVIAFATGWPVAAVIVASAIASWSGCALHEGYSSQCLVGGTDIGHVLYQVGVLGWFMIATIPIGALSFVLWTAGWLFWASRKRQSAAV